jgi:hypothetical protein
MSKPSKIEMEAIKFVSTEKTRKRIKKIGLPDIYLLSLYHKTERQKDFDKKLNETLDDIDNLIAEINRAIKVSKKRVRKFEEIKKGIILDQLKKRVDK